MVANAVALDKRLACPSSEGLTSSTSVRCQEKVPGPNGINQDDWIPGCGGKESSSICSESDVVREK